jgi:hypothetical protein
MGHYARKKCIPNTVLKFWYTELSIDWYVLGIPVRKHGIGL